MKFSNILGNPPYNMPKTKKGKLSGNVLWPQFVVRAIEFQLAEGGSLSFVHPPTWRKPLDENSDIRVWNLLSDCLNYLNINSSERGEEVFGAGTSFDWYHYACSGKDDGSTIINDINGETWEIDLNEWPYLPNSNYDVIKDLIADKGEKKQKVLFDSLLHASRSYVVDKKDMAHSYPVVHSTADGQNIKYTDRVNKGHHFQTSKVIIGESGVGDPIVDMEGEYGCTQGSMGLIVSSREEAEKMVEVLKSDKMDELLSESLQWSTYRIDPRVFRSFHEDWYLHI